MEKDKINEEINNDRYYTVYMHTSPSGKRYIGITSTLVEERWRNGRGYTAQIFYRAVQKYGWDNFKHEILFENLTKEEAEQKEIELIAYYKSNQQNFGYNIANGGNCIGTVSEETKKKLSDAQKGRKLSEETRRKMSEIHKNISDETRKKMSESRTQIVYQFNRKGQLLNKYNSILEANIQTGISACLISSCCTKNAKTAGGYIWSHDAFIDFDNLFWYNSNNKLPVCQYTKNGELVKVYDSIQDASLKTNICKSSIAKCCCNDAKTAGGYIWRYKNEELTQEHIEWCNNIDKKTKRAVIQYSINGELIRIFDSIIAIKKEYGFNDSAVIRCCQHKQFTSYGYIWRYVDDENDEFRKAI